MARADGFMITLGAIVLGLVGFFTIPGILVTIKRFQSRTRHGYEELDKLYEDEDGVATAASEKSFSTTLPVYLVLGGTSFGLISSIATAIYSTVNTTAAYVTEGWLISGTWVRCIEAFDTLPTTDLNKILLLFQAITLFRERHPVRRFNSAFASAASFLVLILGYCWQNIYLAPPSFNEVGTTCHIVSVAVQLACASLSCLSCLLLPRRPLVFSNGQVVDGQFSVSLLSRWTFSWVDGLLAFAKTNRGLDMVHLPQLHVRVRSKYLEASFYAKRRSNILWKDLLQAHRLELFGQSLLAMSQGIIQFAPQLAMYKLLELIEQRSKAKAIASEAWPWTFGLGMSIIIAAWMEAFMHWVVWARIGSPIRSELSALIFSKSTRRKDVKCHQKATMNGNIGANGATEPVVNGLGIQQSTDLDGPTPKAYVGEADEEIQKSRQSVINLIAIDTKRIADFASSHWIFSQTLAKLVVSIVFLVHLIGWPSLLAGFAVSAITLPFNVWASRSYSKTQDGLMKARDRKMVVVIEAMQGIRQIKFSGLESQWQAKIGGRRAEELAMQWKAFAVNTILIGIWILGPVMLSAVALAVFAVLHGNLSPSIAFTTITIFGQIEMTLAIIPELTSEGLGKPIHLPTC